MCPQLREWWIAIVENKNLKTGQKKSQQLFKSKIKWWDTKERKNEKSQE